MTFPRMRCSLWGLRCRGKSRRGLCRAVRRHAGICGRGYRILVGKRGGGSLSRGTKPLDFMRCSNGCRPRAWKQQLQEQLSARFGLCVTICQYPTSWSKWNPIEYRLFSPISRNWAGKPLRTFETVLACLRGTTTQTGLTVSASLLEGVYAIGQKVSNAVMHSRNLHLHSVCPRGNYTLKPRLIAV